MNKILFSAHVAFIGIMMTACSAKLNVSDISYQSIRNAHVDNTPKSRETLSGATILIEPIINSSGEIDINVSNLTDKIMTIDRTKSFYVSPTGLSTVFYDPTIRTTTNSVSSGNTVGASVNLGGVARAANIGGGIGQILNGVNVGGANTTTHTTVNTTYVMDTPVGSIAPHGRASMGRTFTVDNAGSKFLGDLSDQNTSKANVFRQFTLNDSYCRFSICITYSIDDGATYEKFVSEYYCNTAIVSPVKISGKVHKVNEALRNILTEKTDAFDEQWYLLHFNVNKSVKISNYINNQLYDFQ